MADRPRTVRLNSEDNVVIAVDGVPRGAIVDGHEVRDPVPRGHKLATSTIGEGQPVVKFGQTIGFASRPIVPGEHVHEHNCAMGDFQREYRFAETPCDPAMVPAEQRRTFLGFRRASGKVGTRNYVGILTTVNCAASVAKFIVEAVNRSGILADYPAVDGVVSFVHGTGCAMDADGDGYRTLERTQWGHATHPNLAAVLLVGLGCETFQIPKLKERYGLSEGEHFRTMTIQGSGGTRRSVDQGVQIVSEMLHSAARARRETVPASEIVLALQCGGSDGYSGITANPALGRAVDLLVAQGGTAVLSETPEIYGAEHLLTRRAATADVGAKLIERIRWWEDYTARNAMVMNNNPSPGNKAGGLTTILEKSLGAAAKGGTTTLRGVYAYAERITEHGLVFMDSPGYDPASVTGQVASGCNVVAFTTGRGSAFGYKPAPSIKLATNTPMFERMSEDMDINCGDILDGTSIEEKGAEIFDRVLDVASGAQSKSEMLGYGDNEFVPWQIGAVM